jgi:hypothetical protein
MPFSQRWLLDPLRNWRKLQVHAVAMRGLAQARRVFLPNERVFQGREVVALYIS